MRAVLYVLVVYFHLFTACEKLFDFLIRDMLKYTASVREWMSADPQNIIAIHCKGGKGAESLD